MVENLGITIIDRRQKGKSRKNGKLNHRKNWREVISEGDMLNHVHFIAVYEIEDLINKEQWESLVIPETLFSLLIRIQLFYL